MEHRKLVKTIRSMLHIVFAALNMRNNGMASVSGFRNYYYWEQKCIYISVQREHNRQNRNTVMPFSSSRHWCTHWLYVACHCRSLFFGKRLFSAVVSQRRCSLHQVPQDTSRHWKLQSSFILFYVHRSHIQLIRDMTRHAGEWGGGVERGGVYLWIARPCIPARKDRRDRHQPPEQRC